LRRFGSEIFNAIREILKRFSLPCFCCYFSPLAYVWGHGVLFAYVFDMITTMKMMIIFAKSLIVAMKCEMINLWILMQKRWWYIGDNWISWFNPNL